MLKNRGVRRIAVLDADCIGLEGFRLIFLYDEIESLYRAARTTHCLATGCSSVAFRHAAVATSGLPSIAGGLHQDLGERLAERPLTC